MALRATIIRLAESATIRPLTIQEASAALLPPIPLYRGILRAHRRLPIEMRYLGDEYVKAGWYSAARTTSAWTSRMRTNTYVAEFHRHQKITNPVHIIGFLHEWKIYLDTLPSNPGDEFKGRKLDPALLEKVSVVENNFDEALPWVLQNSIATDVTRTDWTIVRTDACHEGRLEAGPILARRLSRTNQKRVALLAYDTIAEAQWAPCIAVTHSLTSLSSPYAFIIMAAPSSASALRINPTSEPFNNLPAICTSLFEAKARKGYTFEQIGEKIGRDEVWVASAFYGQAKLTPKDIAALANVLEIQQDSLEAELGENWWPRRGGLGPMPPTDPVIYRLYEGVLVYGHAIKFGDGIQSMIDCKVTVDKKEDPKGDRVVLTFDGKFLKYSQW
ncbi:hypothetical protein NM688_g2784 [Phlebia brevispora]|uniref:Uncharacterized protein n=1 Tax=Phlebia brevispora TaxID=194682 RepID=A0ACC1T806_9APHY|nr:hypothetical protein NM688_g2784 [Phlebia brevispora]